MGTEERLAELLKNVLKVAKTLAAYLISAERPAVYVKTARGWYVLTVEAFRQTEEPKGLPDHMKMDSARLMALVEAFMKEREGGKEGWVEKEEALIAERRRQQGSRRGRPKGSKNRPKSPVVTTKEVHSFMVQAGEDSMMMGQIPVAEVAGNLGCSLGLVELAAKAAGSNFVIVKNMAIFTGYEEE